MKRAKTKIAIIFGYVGEKYFACNGTICRKPTVEVATSPAPCRLDLRREMGEDVMQSLVGREPRTDKGVHALKNSFQ